MWEKLEDKAQTVNEIIKSLNNKTPVDLEILGIEDTTTFIM
jgi:hypothetical protein